MKISNQSFQKFYSYNHEGIIKMYLTLFLSIVSPIQIQNFIPIRALYFYEPLN